MDKLHQFHTQIIVDLNSAAAYLREAREMFIDGKLTTSVELIGHSLREIGSAQKNIEKFLTEKYND